MIIDAHCHIWDRDWQPQKFWDLLMHMMGKIYAREGREISESQLQQEFAHHYFDPNGDKLIQTLDEAGIDKAVVLVLDFGLALGEAQISIQQQNQDYGRIMARHPSRLIPFAGVDPRRLGATDLLEQAVTEWGLQGLKLHPTAGFAPNEPATYKLLEKAYQLNLPVLFHTGPVPAPLRTKYAHPLYLTDVAVDFPGLRIIAAHLSFCWWTELATFCSHEPNLFCDISGWQPFAKRNYAGFCQILRAILDTAGPEKVLFGTDGPFLRPFISDGEYLRIIRGLPERAPAPFKFTQQEVDAILGGNAQRLLNIS